MRVSLGWLREHVDIELDPEELAHRLDMSGTKVEALHRPGEGIQGVVVAEVLAIEPHPNADTLSMVEVNQGGEQHRVVCGAKNFSVGDRVPLALVGSKLPGLTITERKIRGEVSRGMLCSGSELGISKDHSGILVLQPDAPLGQDVVELLHLDDVILELEITPNRPDCMSVHGVAREVAAITDKVLKSIPVPLESEPGTSPKGLSVDIQDLSGCPRYLARRLSKVQVGPSPVWMAARLLASGVRPISNVVDATNYVLLEMGQPLHAFDAARVVDQHLIVRRATPGEVLKTLDDVDRHLHPDDLVIADPAKGLAIAGVMGGADSEVTPGTTEIILESAYFEPTAVAYTSRRHGLRSEASARFERGLDADGVAPAALRASSLIAEIAGGEEEGAVDRYPKPVERSTIRLRPCRTTSLLGLELEPARQADHLTSVGIGITEEGDELVATVPLFRPDLSREIDLIEEIARLEGFDKLPSSIPSGPSGGLDPRQRAERTLRRVLVTSGVTEAWTGSFQSPSELDDLDLDEDHPARRMILLENPMSEQEPALRTTLLPGLLRSAGLNASHRAPGIALFEIARTYRPGRSQLAEEELALAAVFSGERIPKTWSGDRSNWDIFAVKGLLNSATAYLGLPALRFERVKGAPFHPGRAAQIYLGSRPLGVVGELHPDICSRFEVPERTLTCEVSVEELLVDLPDRRKASALPTQPSIFIDLAFVVDEVVASAELTGLIEAAGAPEIVASRLFDVYRGDQVPDGKKSLAYALELRSSDRTMTDTEASAVTDRIVTAARERLDAQLRA
jgi:phenylalanyl-tRNA synthetase beta chain